MIKMKLKEKPAERVCKRSMQLDRGTFTGKNVFKGGLPRDEKFQYLEKSYTIRSGFSQE